MAPNNGNSNRSQIAYNIFDATPSTLFKHVDIYTVRHAKYTTPALNTLTELPSIPLFPYLLFSSGFLINFTYLAAQLNREKLGQLDLR